MAGNDWLNLDRFAVGVTVMYERLLKLSIW